MVLTSLSTESFSAKDIIALYRLRWQVEIAFKRLKSLLQIGKLRAKKPELARSWIAAHLIAALLLDTMTQDFLDSPPVADLGAGLGASRVPSLWRIQQALHSALLAAIRGLLTCDILFRNATRLIRTLWDPPRKRKKQSQLIPSCLS